MRAEILTIGDELCRGEIVDTNSSTLAQRLWDLDITTRWMTSCTDDADDIATALRTAVARADLVSLPEPPADEPHLPYAAAGLPSGSYPAEGFELPPRVRVDPAVPSTVDGWLEVAEERYGFPVRSARAVASW